MEYETEDVSVGLYNSTYTDQSEEDASLGNDTFLEEAPELNHQGVVKASVLASMAVVAIAGNLATLISISCCSTRYRRHGRNSSLYVLLLQLAVADLLVSIWCLSGEAAWTLTVQWIGGDFLCKLFKFSQVFSLYLSTLTMVLIGFDRLSAIRHPMEMRSCAKQIAAVWIVSALLASPQSAVFRVKRGPFRQPFYQCVTYGFYTEDWQEKIYIIFSIVTMFVIPLVLLIGCYICIFCSLSREKTRPFPLRTYQGRSSSSVSAHAVQLLQHPTSRNNSGDNPTGRENLYKRARKKALALSIVIVTAFLLCWTPYYFMMIAFIFFEPDEKLGEELHSVIFFFGMSNSLVNPLIYGAFHLCRLPDCCRRKSRRGHIRHTRRRGTCNHTTTGETIEMVVTAYQ